jgi:hypothetical protein
MKIKTIDIKNYKAFYSPKGSHQINVDGKNLFVYGENGSGKSSFYYALKDFFQSSNEPYVYSETENIFLTQSQKGKGHIKVTFNPDKDGNPSDKQYELTKRTNTTYTTGDTSIRDAIKLKSFLTYKHLLGVHYINKDSEIDLFNLLVNGVLKHFKSSAVTGTKELGELWKDVEDSIAKPLNGRVYNITQKKSDVDTAVNVFNVAFKKLFQVGGIENIVKYAQPILDKFGYNIQLELRYTQVKPNTDYDDFERNHVRVKVKYLGKEIEKPHFFLNEARLSAIAISIYLGMIKRHVQGGALKVLFLDDIFIGLDIGNRLPLLKILESDFSAYQIIITTYDKPWYEFLKTSFFSNNPNWKSYEFYSRRTRKGFDVPIIKEVKGRGDSSHINYYLTKAQDYYNNAENKAAGVYLRSSFEFILKQYCFGKVPIPFKINTSEIKTDVFWNRVKKYKSDNPTRCNLTDNTKDDIDRYIRLVLNPLSHHEINKHEFKNEIQGAITTMSILRMELNV